MSTNTVCLITNTLLHSLGTEMILSFRTDKTNFLGKHCRPRSDWSGSTLLVIASASFGHTVNFLNIRTPKKICCNHSKIWTMWLYHRVMSPNAAGGMANSVDPDQTALLGAVWSGSAPFAQTCLSENLGSLQYTWMVKGHCLNFRIITAIFAVNKFLEFLWIFGIFTVSQILYYNLWV